MVIRCLLWYNRLDFQQSHQATRLKANRRNFMMCSWAVGLIAKCFRGHWKPLWTEMRLCQRKKNPRMPPFILKTSEPQFVQDSGSSASLCLAHIPPIHIHLPLETKLRAGWSLLLRVVILDPDGAHSGDSENHWQVLRPSEAKDQCPCFQALKPFSDCSLVDISALLFLPLHAATVPLLWPRCTVLTGVAWSQGVGRELLAARAGTLPPVTHLPHSSASGDAAWAGAYADPTQASMNRASCRLCSHLLAEATKGLHLPRLKGERRVGSCSWETKGGPQRFTHRDFWYPCCTNAWPQPPLIWQLCRHSAEAALSEVA